MNVQQVITSLESGNLHQRYDKLVDAGEMPYRMNLKALQEFDVKDDPEAGKEALAKMNAGINAWIAKLEQFSDVAAKVSKRASAVRET